jgi:hypothetical protein
MLSRLKGILATDQGAVLPNLAVGDFFNTTELVPQDDIIDVSMRARCREQK